MAIDSVSARDPTFYRWHFHCEEFIRKFKEKKMSPYEKKDFSESDDISVTKVTTLIPGKDVGMTKDLVNKLITFYEEETVDLGQNGKVTYPRLNHIDFSYQISIENPRKTQKKVIVRLWLGLS